MAHIGQWSWWLWLPAYAAFLFPAIAVAAFIHNWGLFIYAFFPQPASYLFGMAGAGAFIWYAIPQFLV